MRGEATTADGQTTATASTKPSDIPVKNNGAMCSPPPPPPPATVPKMSPIVNGMSDPPPPEASTTSNGVVENGVDAPPTPSISPPPVASEDEDALLEEEVAKPTERSFSDSGSVGDLSLRLSDDDDDEAEKVVADSVVGDKLDSSDDGVVAEVVSEEGGAGAPSAASHDDLVCSPKDDPEHSSKPFMKEVDLKSVRDLDDACSNDNHNPCELSPNADSKCVENSSDKVGECDPKQDVDIVAAEAVSDESDGTLVDGDVICKPMEGILEEGEDLDSGTVSRQLDNVEGGVDVEELPVVLVGASEEPVLELVSDEAVDIGNKVDEMEVDEGYPNSSVKVENELVSAQDDSDSGIAVANITDDSILSSGGIDDGPEDVCMKEEPDCARDDSNMVLKVVKEERMEISSASDDENENGAADVDVKTDIDIKSEVSEMDDGNGEKDEIALVKSETDSQGIADVNVENKVSESLSENSTLLVPKIEDHVGLVPTVEDGAELLPQEAEVMDTAALKEVDFEPEKLHPESDTGEKLMNKSEIKLCGDGSPDDLNDEVAVGPTVATEVVDEKDLGDSMSTTELPELNHAEVALNPTEQSKEMQETDVKKVVITAETSEAKQEETLNDVEHTEAKQDEILNNVEHTDKQEETLNDIDHTEANHKETLNDIEHTEAKQEETLNDVEHPEAKHEEILNDVEHTEAKAEKAVSDAEHTELKQDHDFKDAEDSVVKQVEILNDVVHSEAKQVTGDANPPEFMETDNLVDEAQDDNSSKMDTSEIVENKCPALMVENVDIAESKATADNVKEGKATLKDGSSMDNSDDTLPMKTDGSNDLGASADPDGESELPKCAETFNERIKRQMLASLDDSDSSGGVSGDESRPEGKVVAELENGVGGDDAPGTDTNEGSVGSRLKLKRESDGEGVASSPSASKRPRRSLDIADESDVKNADVADPHKENVHSGNGKSAQKRGSERPVLRGDVKKVRRTSGEDDVNAADAKPTPGRRKTTSQASKTMTNLDKAIARVATGGLSKRDRETCELLKLLDCKSIEHITASQLDDLVKLKICEVVMQECEVSKLRERIVTLEAGVEKWKDLARNTAKQLRDLELVFKKLAADGKQENPTVMPIKITRSVGLQVGAGSLAVLQTPAQQQQIQQQQMQRKLIQQQHQKKAGIITNRPANGGPPMGRPSNLRQVPPTMGPRPPLGQPLAAQPAPGVAAGGKIIIPASARLTQNVSPSTSPGKPASSPGGTPSTYPGMTRMVQVAPVGGGRPTPNGVRAPANAGRPAQVRVAPSTAKMPAGCIDLTEEDDKAVVPVTNSVSPAVVSVVNQSPAKQVMTSGIRIVPQNQLTGNPTAPVLAAVAVPASPRLAFVVPAPATAGGPTRSLVFTTAAATQLPGNRSILTVARPRLAAPSQNVILGSNSVHTLPAVGAHAAVVRAPAGGPARRIMAVTPTNRLYRMPVIVPNRHPAPLPPSEYVVPNASWKKSPPQPELKISKCDSRQRGIILSWKMEEFSEEHEPITTYQLFAYQEPANATPSTSMWKRVGDVKAMALPMACTLTQFSEGNKYHFAVRAVDIRNRFGPFSVPGSLMLSRS